MAKLITVFWRHIPAQVIARQGRQSAKAQLSDRFQEAIDRAAMRAGKGSTDAYLEEWRRETSECAGDLDAAVKARVDELEAAFDDERLAGLIRAKGVDEAGGASE